MKYLTALAAAFTAATLLAAPASAETEPPALISVTGEATVSVAPDLAQIDGGVTSEAKTAREASDANNAAMGKVLLAHLPTQECARLLDGIELARRGPNTLTKRASLIAELKRVRAAGIATNNEELAFGLRSIAVPVRGQSGEVVAAINLAVHRSWVSMEDLVQRLSPALEQTAAAVSARLGYRAV